MHWNLLFQVSLPCSSSYSVAEDGIVATIHATRTGDSDGAVSIDYTTSDDTALAGYDYTAASGTLFWDNGDLLDNIFTITILGDALAEGDEMVNIVFANPTGGAFLGTPHTAVLTITDVSEAGGGGGGCFIGTATHESYMNPFMESFVIVFSKLLEIKKQQIELFLFD